ncbi:MAG: DUF721 domain-containing protein [Coxiellaceae bacterium]|nr:MAG: DUF721 domain-containing protein [Coxiellaceae bacterium]
MQTFDEMSLQPLNQILTKTKLASITAKAKCLSQLEQALQVLLPPDCASHCKVAHWQDGNLGLVVETAAMMTRLRFLHDQLLAALGADPLFQGIKSIQYRVRPKISTATVKPHWQPNVPGPEALAMLTATAMETQEIALRQALLNLVAGFSNSKKNV